MIDNTAHDILVQAADEVGRDEETMLFLATGFIAGMGSDAADLALFLSMP